MTDSFAFLIVTLIIILGFEAVNGWTDAPNAIATVVSTRVLNPSAAVALAAVFNLLGALSGTAVATTIGKGIVDLNVVTLETVAAAALSVIIWSSLAAYFGLPTSESHGIVAGIAGAGVAVGGTDVLLWSGWQKVFTGLGVAVTGGFIGAFLLMFAITWALRRASPTFTRRLFGPLQLASAAFMAWSHGTADGQKAMGVMAMALAIHYHPGEAVDSFSVPLWVIFLAAGTMAVSTAFGGWRIIRTLGMRLTHLQPVHGFAAETAAAMTITVSSRFGIPLSTTHTIGSAIMGVGATRRLSAVRWGIAQNIVMAWILTFPVCFGLGWLIAWLLP
ncbi:MAG TPA: inorganic phosphate transporter [Dehalococcoidia bacterium]|nr:inorganic phosphate transporter [Dehalococcoidia bacterium]